MTVRSGAATIASANGSESLSPGSTLVADGSGIGSQNPIGFDSFDQFNISRDQAVVSSYNSNPYVSPQLAGYSNFAKYGQWQNVPGYGEAWAPNNQSQTNFTPYQNGQWVWEPGSGYTWVDNSPTGYATSHYGSWFHDQNRGGWLWQPPANQYQQSSSSLASAWLPAAVSFFLSGNSGSSGAGLGGLLGGASSGGNGGGLNGMLGSLSGLFGNSGNVDNSNANIGWVPLAPGEQYQPWYGQNNSYPTTSLSSASNTGNLYNYYRNMQYTRAATMIPVSAWRSGNFSRRVSVPAQQLSRVAFIRGAIPIVPTTANLRYSSASKVAHPIILSRTFAAPRLAARAPAVTRNAFVTQQAKIRSIASVRPKLAQLAPRPAPVTHAVYRPVVRPSTHVAVIKPVAPVAPHITHLLAPGARPIRAIAPAAKVAPNHSATIEHRVSPPATTKSNVARPLSPAAHQPNATVARPLRTAAPVVKPGLPPKARAVTPVHTVAPIANPLVHSAPAVVPKRTLAPEVKHVAPVHTAIPVAKPLAPSVHTAAPTVKPLIAPPVRAATPIVKPTVAPPVRTATPIVKPAVAPPVHTAAPVVKPAVAPPVRAAAPTVKATVAPPVRTVAPAAKVLPHVAPPVAAPVKAVPPAVDTPVKKPAEPPAKSTP